MSETGKADGLQRLVGQKDYPCLMARWLVRRGQHTSRRYPSLSGDDAAGLGALARDLRLFARKPRSPRDFDSFVAIFGGTPPATEEAFEAALWDVLSGLSARDASEWDPQVSADPEAPRFSFSFAGHAFYVIGLHPAASRPARRCERPTLVFNRHEQFERLRSRGDYAALRARIRERDRAYSGSVNPMLDDFGERSEARQYSGREVGPDWGCPFRRDHR